jgi:predicted aspartyl protease
MSKKIPWRGFLILGLLLASTTLYAGPATAPATIQATEPAVPEPRATRLVGALPAHLTVRKAHTGHLLVSPLINGQQLGSFIFDTGAGMSCVDREVVKKLALADAGEALANGSGGSQKTRLRAIDSLSLGPVQVVDSAVVELDLRMISAALFEPLDGIIGYECFLPGIYEIDIEAASITVHAPDGYRLPQGAAWHPLLLKERRPYVRGKIEDKEEGLFLLDTGATGAVGVEARTVKKLKLTEKRKTGGSMFGGVGGMLAARSGTLDTFAVCGQTLKDVNAVFATSDKGANTLAEVQGTIGLDILKRFRLIVDYAKSQVALVPK